MSDSRSDNLTAPKQQKGYVSLRIDGRRGYARWQNKSSGQDEATEDSRGKDKEPRQVKELSSFSNIDSLFGKALEIVLLERKCSIARLQRRLGIGYDRAANLIEFMEKIGVVSAPIAGNRVVLIGSKPEIEGSEDSFPNSEDDEL